MATTLSPRSCPSSPGLASSIRGRTVISWPPSRALRWLREAGSSAPGHRWRGVRPGACGVLSAAVAEDVSLHNPLDHHGAAVELEGGIAHHTVEMRDRVDLAAVGDRVPEGDVRGAARRL